MPVALVIAALVAAVLAAMCAFYWASAWVRIVHTLRTLPTLRDGARMPAPASPRKVCAIVPAHNEQDVLGRLLESLERQDHPALTIVLGLDRCTDDTLAIARSFVPRLERGGKRLEIVEIDSCPEGWAGKTHAVWSGVTRSQAARDADLLLFLDADTFLEPQCVRAAVALLEERGLGMLSVLSTLTTDRWFERLAQPCAALELLRQYPLTSANRWPDPRPFANGQCMLFTRTAYDAAGGHEAVHDELLEDIALARRLFYANERSGVLLADGALSCRMYGSWEEFRRGWKRIYTESANRRSERLASLAWRMRFSGIVLPLASLAALVVGAWALRAHGLGQWAGWVPAAFGLAGTIAYLGAMVASLREQRAPHWAAPLQPLGAWLVSAILAEAASDLRHGRATAWGGLSYTIEDRGKRPHAREATDPAHARW